LELCIYRLKSGFIEKCFFEIEIALYLTNDSGGELKNTLDC
jgi:hypothetical protein